MWLSWVLVGLQTAVPIATPAQASRFSLGRAVSLALEVAPRRARAIASVHRAESDVKAAKSEAWPQLGFDGLAVRFNEPMLVAPLHRFDVSQIPDFERTLVQAQIGIGYLLFDGGARRSAIDRALALERAAGAQLTSTEQGVVASTVHAYVGVISARDGLSAQVERLRALRSEADRVDRFFREGQAARVEQLRVSAAVASARADSASTAAFRRVSEGALARLTGRDVGDIGRADLIRVVLRPGVRQAVVGSSISDAVIEASPTLREAAARVTAAEASSRAARAAWLPSIRLEGRTISYGSAGGSDVPLTTEWAASLRVTYPLFTGGRRAARIDRGEALTQEAKAARRETVLALGERADQLLAEMEETRERIAALEVAITQLRDVVRVEALALREGVGLQSDYLRAEAELAATRAERSRTWARQITAHVRLEQLLGRLTPETVDSLVEAVP